METLNIYQMYVRNGYQCGFWVKRNSWSKNIARVTSIAGQFEGPLEGDPPYFKNPKVQAEVFHEQTGRMNWVSGESGRQQILTCAGTYGYALIPQPDWWKGL